MKRFIFTLLFALTLGVGQTFAFEDVGDQQTVLQDESCQFVEQTDLASVAFENLEFADTGQDKRTCYLSPISFETFPAMQKLWQTPARLHDDRQEVLQTLKLPPNFKAAAAV